MQLAAAHERHVNAEQTVLFACDDHRLNQAAQLLWPLGLSLCFIPPSRHQSHPRHAGVMDLGAAQGFQQVEVVHCRGFDDAAPVAWAVREGRTVVLQLERLDPIEAQRVVDFVSGAVHALGGQSQRLGLTSFLFAPGGVVLSSS